MGRFSPQRRGGRREMRKSQDVRLPILPCWRSFAYVPKFPLRSLRLCGEKISAKISQDLRSIFRRFPQGFSPMR